MSLQSYQSNISVNLSHYDKHQSHPPSSGLDQCSRWSVQHHRGRLHYQQSQAPSGHLLAVLRRIVVHHCRPCHISRVTDLNHSRILRKTHWRLLHGNLHSGTVARILYHHHYHLCRFTRMDKAMPLTVTAVQCHHSLRSIVTSCQILDITIRCLDQCRHFSSGQDRHLLTLNLLMGVDSNLSPKHSSIHHNRNISRRSTLLCSISLNCIHLKLIHSLFSNDNTSSLCRHSDRCPSHHQIS